MKTKPRPEVNTNKRNTEELGNNPYIKTTSANEIQRNQMKIKCNTWEPGTLRETDALVTVFDLSGRENEEKGKSKEM